MRWSRRLGVLVGGVALLSGTAVAEARDQRPRLAISGAPSQLVGVCGAGRTAVVAPTGARVVARVVARRTSKPPRLTVERCENGRWVGAARVPLRGTRRIRARLDTTADGDYRLRARLGRARSKAAYLRVGVGEIVDEPVRFGVLNTNRSKLPCPTDGARYVIAGTLVGPRAALLAAQRSVTVYSHGVEVDGTYWRFKGVPGYDYATEMARAGHVSVVLDRLGAGTSGRPEGTGSCLGGQADTVHQVISALRAGRYDADGGATPKFGSVALAGHSFGTYVAQLEAYSFQDVDALVATAFNAQGTQAGLLAERIAQGESSKCGVRTYPAGPGGPGGYAYLWPSTETWADDTYFNTDPRILTIAKRDFRQRAPCGDLNTAVPLAAVEEVNLSSITVPVLLVFARQDKVFPPPAGEQLRDRYTGSRDVTLETIEDAGHTLMLQRTAPRFRAVMSDWLRRHGF